MKYFTGLGRENGLVSVWINSTENASHWSRDRSLSLTNSLRWLDNENEHMRITLWLLIQQEMGKGAIFTGNFPRALHIQRLSHFLIGIREWEYIWHRRRCYGKKSIRLLKIVNKENQRSILYLKILYLKNSQNIT